MRRTGRHFLQIPGPTNVPDRVLQAMGRPTIDHRGPDLPALAGETVEGLRSVFNTKGPVLTYPGSATGGWFGTAAMSAVVVTGGESSVPSFTTKVTM